MRQAHTRRVGQVCVLLSTERRSPGGGAGDRGKGGGATSGGVGVLLASESNPGSVAGDRASGGGATSGGGAAGVRERARVRLE